jgi:DnaJ-class molecular chaperone
MQNPYQTLGVDRNASPDEIKRAYRRLASKHHPDKGGDKTRFQEIQAAYEAITNPRPNTQNPFGHTNNGGNNGAFDFDHIFNVFGARFQQPHQRMQQQARMSLWITLKDAAQGGRRSITVGTAQGTQVVEIEIPAGINDSDSVQYPGIGPGGMDLIISFRIHPDAQWTRQGLDLITEHVLDMWDLILGTELQVRDILGHTLSVNIAAGTQPGTMMRLRGRGITARTGQAGDLLIKIQTRIPTDIPEDLVKQIRDQCRK